jgi:hypothetical protein
MLDLKFYQVQEELLENPGCPCSGQPAFSGNREIYGEV